MSIPIVDEILEKQNKKAIDQLIGEIKKLKDRLSAKDTNSAEEEKLIRQIDKLTKRLKKRQLPDL